MTLSATGAAERLEVLASYYSTDEPADLERRARAHLRATVAALRSSKVTLRDADSLARTAVDTAVLCGFCALVSGQAEAALTDFTWAEGLARQHRAGEPLAHALGGQAQVFSPINTLPDPRIAEGLLDEATRHASADVTLMWLEMLRAESLAALGDTRAALHATDRACFRAGGSDHGGFVSRTGLLASWDVSTLDGMTGRAYRLLGFHEEAREELGVALAGAAGRGLPRTHALWQGDLALCHTAAGEYEEAARLCIEFVGDARACGYGLAVQRAEQLCAQMPDCRARRYLAEALKR